ncbi:MAG: hypothetical protein V5A32_07385, partial [Halovenus sp.]
TLGVPVVGVEVAVDSTVVNTDEIDLRNPRSDVGELLVRGGNVTDGYWNRPGATDRAFTTEHPGEDRGSATTAGVATDGSGKWFRTGDLIEQTPEGFLVFHERLKQILVPDTGKNVAPQPIEDHFSTNDRVEQVVIVGDRQKYIGALIVPNFESMRAWAETEGIDLPDDTREAVEDDRVEEWVGEAVAEVNDHLEKHEKIRGFALVGEEWTPENKMLTPSMKKVRKTILDAHQQELREIYGEDYRPRD